VSTQLSMRTLTILMRFLEEAAVGGVECQNRVVVSWGCCSISIRVRRCLCLSVCLSICRSTLPFPYCLHRTLFRHILPLVLPLTDPGTSTLLPPVDPDGPDITIDGTIALCIDLNVDPEDVVMLAVAYELGSQRMGEWNKTGWVDGWKKLG
jgi:hypothetical protein